MVLSLKLQAKTPRIGQMIHVRESTSHMELLSNTSTIARLQETDLTFV